MMWGDLRTRRWSVLVAPALRGYLVAGLHQHRVQRIDFMPEKRGKF